MGSGIWRSAMLLGCAMALSACGDMKIAPGAQKTAATAFERFRHGDDKGFIAMIEPDQRANASPEILAQMHQLVPPGEPTNARQTGWRVNYDTSGRSVMLVEQYDYGSRALTVTTVLVPGAGQTWLVRGFNVNVSANPGAKPRSAPAPRTAI